MQVTLLQACLGGQHSLASACSLETNIVKALRGSFSFWSKRRNDRPVSSLGVRKNLEEAEVCAWYLYSKRLTSGTAHAGPPNVHMWVFDREQEPIDA